MTKEEDEKTVEKILERVRKVCGFVPVTNQILSERPDLFIPYSSLSGAIFENETNSTRRQNTCWHLRPPPRWGANTASGTR